MSSAASQFAKAVEIVGALPPDGAVKPSDDDKLYFYARFKQASVGDCTTAKPGMFDFVGKAKWTAWEAIKGKSADEAKAEYVAKLKSILSSSSDPSAQTYLQDLESA